MRYIPYVIAGLVIFWAVFSLVRHFRKTKGGDRCQNCSGCCEGCSYHNKNEENGKITGD